MRSSLAFLALASSLTVASAAPSFAADYAVPPITRHAATVPYIDRGPNPYCGPRCGCPIVARVRHHSLEQAYSYTFDPRTRDEPHYYYGPVRTYVRYANPAYPEQVLTY
ncbi:hypothetical protein [Bradyrhizobium sp. CCGUVB23]|uniref:hypothetical protein n=1 Tax=Bradyrhizobium sp. CCGUVB23 TaxID=2949630 RepID=UPI0020B21578|nr:hypothetical protein [Bradyrhizobium sp. CCGUVB23]MCP3460096.1 hypothetical protein [Bradyrhizobium sp. CCGUVB23]